jgi:hypothetical protein
MKDCRVNFACFACRKTFKQGRSSNWDSNVPKQPFTSPERKPPMTRMGAFGRTRPPIVPEKHMESP